MARLTDTKILFKKKLSLQYREDKPPADLILLQTISDDLDLIDGDGIFLCDFDGQHIQTV